MEQNVKPRSTGVYGLRDVRDYKVYRLDSTGKYYAAHKTGGHVRRIQLSNRAEAELIATFKDHHFVEHINQLLEGAKRSGSINYFEEKRDARKVRAKNFNQMQASAVAV